MLDTAVRSARDVIQAAAAALADAGCDTPRLDAELLLSEALGTGWSRPRLVTADAAPLDPAALARFETLLARRRVREPVAYILGRKDFRRISLTVDRRVLIPRPETELLVELGLTLPSAARVVDIGTGSGAVALALKDERPDLRVTGIDVSNDALAVARGNGRRLGLSVRFVEADLLDGATYDAVVANLPYVADGVGGQLAPEIRGYEPSEALFAGSNGLDVIRRLAAQLGDAARASVKLAALEVAPEQAAAVGDLLGRSGFRSIEALCDLAGHERVVVGRR
jgi:release factor glutamine methyltransferase